MIIPAANRLSQVQEYYFSRKLQEIAQLQAQGQAILNLGIGSPDLAPHASVIQSLQAHSNSIDNHAYQSYRGLDLLRQAFAHWYQQYFHVSLNAAQEVLPLMGSKEGIMHISMAFLNPGDQVLIPNPGYPTYAAAARLAGAQVCHYELKEEQAWLPDLTTLAQQDLSRVKLMWINYPHMPTGAHANTHFFEQLIAFAHEHNILIVNDNPYAFILNDSPLSLLSIAGAKAVALELNSLSKAHNMAGWRIGMLAGHPTYIDTVLKFKSNMDSGMFKPLQLAAAQALSLPPTWYEQQNEVYKTRRSIASQILNKIGCTFASQQGGMFIWARIPQRYTDAYALSDELLEKYQIFITPGAIFGSAGKHYLRISLCNPPPILQEALKRLIY